MADTTARTDTGRSADAIMSSPPPRNWRPWIYAVIAVVVATAIVITIVLIADRRSAPIPAPKAPPKPQQSAAATPTPPAEAAAAAAAAIAAYNGYFTALEVAQQTSNANEPRLKTYAAGSLIIQTQTSLDFARQHGFIQRGHYNNKVTRTEVKLATQSVHLAGCSDISAVHAIDRATGKSIDAPGTPKRFTFTALAQLYQGRWVITRITPNSSQPC